jgi:hypothetical protein
VGLAGLLQAALVADVVGDGVDRSGLRQSGKQKREGQVQQ